MLKNTKPWKAGGMHGLDFDPTLAELLAADQAQPLSLPHGTKPVWLFTRYDQVQEVVSDPRFSRNAVLGADAGRSVAERPLLRDDPTYQDGEVHARIRRALAKVFVPARIGPLQVRAEAVAARLVAAVRDSGPPAELVAALTSPFGLETSCATVGVPHEEWGVLRDSFEAVFTNSTPAEEVRQARQRLAELFHGLIRRGRSHPGDDLIGVLCSATGADQLTDGQIAAAAYHCAHAGWQAVRNHCGNLLYTLLSRPKEYEWLCRSPQALPGAIDELLRFIPRMAGVGIERIATEDVCIGGVTVARGEAAYVSYAAANRDPRVFAEPDRLDLTRSPNPHVAYGYGPHYCPASAVATMEFRALLGAVVRALPGLRLAVAADAVPWRTSDLLRGPQQLPVEW